MSAQTGNSRRGVSGMFRALSHRNFRLFWAGAFLSNTGTWMQAVAQGILVYQLTSSPFWLGVDGFMATAPGLALTLLAGVFADLVDRRRLLLFTQVGAGLSALTLAVVIITGVVHVWMILALSFVTGCCFAVAGPSYQAITVDLVEREDLANAIALNSTQFQFSRVIGPTLAGVALAYFGLAGCFFANALSFVAVIAALMMVRFDEKKTSAPAHSVKDRKAVWQDLVEGLRYVRRRHRVFMLLLISGMTSLFGAPYMSMIPVYARDIFHMDKDGNALLMGFSGAGAFIGALVLAYLGNFKYKGWSVLCGAFGFALCLIGFALSPQLLSGRSFSTQIGVALAFIFGMGFAIVSCVAVVNTLLQQLVTDEMRGRVMSMFILSFIGTMPIGNLIAGAAAERFGAPYTLAAGGLIIAIFIVVVSVRNKRLRELH
ncbi:MAG TPA: MFS transporter [Pyrinomonadaceae bacterium]|nr:MFS transporter [Pyrinomonadaceae bacterium]